MVDFFSTFSILDKRIRMKLLGTIFLLTFLSILSSCGNGDSTTSSDTGLVNISNEVKDMSDDEVKSKFYLILEASIDPKPINMVNREELGISWDGIKIENIVSEDDFKRYEIRYKQWLYTPWDRMKDLELFPMTAHLNVYPMERYKLTLDCSHSARCTLSGEANTLYWFRKP
jgi:hypothetical protein